MDLVDYRDAAVLVSTLLSIGGVVYIWVTSKGAEAHRLAEAAHDEIKLLQRRTDALEVSLQHLPTKEDFHTLKLSLSDLSGRIGVVTERLQANNALAERLQELLLERGAK